jgi:hypothetical protein
MEKGTAIEVLPDLGVCERHRFERFGPRGTCGWQADIGHGADHEWHCAAGEDADDDDWLMDGESDFVFLWVGELQ